MSSTGSLPTLKFADEHVDAILAGEKTATIRLDLVGDALPEGEPFQLADESGDPFARAVVENRSWTTVAMAAKIEFDGHRRYEDSDELIEELEEYYPDHDIDWSTTVELVYWDADSLAESEAVV